jgi:hypothetical protein
MDHVPSTRSTHRPKRFKCLLGLDCFCFGCRVVHQRDPTDTGKEVDLLFMLPSVPRLRLDCFCHQDLTVGFDCAPSSLDSGLAARWYRDGSGVVRCCGTTGWKPEMAAARRDTSTATGLDFLSPLSPQPRSYHKNFDAYRGLRYVGISPMRADEGADEGQQSKVFVP